MGRAMKLRGILPVALVVLVAGCSSAPDPSPATASPVTSSLSISVTSAVKSSSAEDALAGLCERHCKELADVYALTPCSSGVQCQGIVTQADDAIDSLRSDMSGHNIDRDDYPDLDDALTAAASAIQDYDKFRCIDEVKGSADMLTCAVEALNAKTTVETLRIVIGGKP